MNETAVILIGLAVRFGIPVVLTILGIVILHRLDQQWRASAQAHRSQMVDAGLTPRNTGCWNVMHCSEEKKATCKAYASQNLPCWQIFRSKDGEMQDRCLVCKLFTQAPIPVKARIV